LQPEFAERIDAIGRLKESIKKYTFDGNLREGQIKRMEVPHNVIRLEACDIATRSFKMEYRYPLWDVRLIEYYLALPPHMKAQQGWGRYIFRKASEHLVPQSVIWRTIETGSSNPHLFNRAAQDIDEVINELLSVPRESKYHQYADNTKFAKKRDVVLNKHTLSYHRFAPVFNNIILADKLKNVSE
jgi:asparagine synthase (glutamine-hydrolysing)